MHFTAIIKARTLVFLDLDELNSNGKVRLVDVIPEIVKRYDFKSFPTKFEEVDIADKGASFKSGKIENIVIDELKIYSGLTYVETLSSTQDSALVLKDILSWGKENLGLTYSEDMLKHWAYVSQVSFTTDYPLLSRLSPPINNLAKKIGTKVSSIFDQDLNYEPLNLVIGHDPQIRKNPIAAFTISRRANTPFADNKYFSEAPLPTDAHIKFLQELETELLNQK